MLAAWASAREFPLTLGAGQTIQARSPGPRARAIYLSARPADLLSAFNQRAKPGDTFSARAVKPHQRRPPPHAGRAGDDL